MNKQFTPLKAFLKLNFSILLLLFYQFGIAQTFNADYPANGNCEDIQLIASGNSLSISGLTAPIEIVEVYDDNWQQIFRCQGTDCGNEQIINNLSNGTHHVKVQFFTDSWEEICKFEGDTEIGGILCICTNEVDPVCGSDGITYSNPCLADCASVTWTRGACNTNTPSCTDVIVDAPPTGELRPSIFVNGLTAPIEIVKIYDASWNLVFECNNNCGSEIQFSETNFGKYYVQVQMYTENWEWICQTENMEVEVVQSTDCATNLLLDKDKDGVCEDRDCDDNDPNIGERLTQGTACDDGDLNTINDVIQADGCTCAGTPISSDPCAQVRVKIVEKDPRLIEVEGLNTGRQIVKIYDSRWNKVRDCSNDLEDCNIFGVFELGLYRVYVQLYTADWQYICETDFIEITVPDDSNSSRSGSDFIDESKITLFPNPALNTLNIRTYALKDKKTTIQIFNTFGQQIQELPTKVFRNDFETIDVSNYENGLYLMTIQAENRRIISKRFLVENLK